MKTCAIVSMACLSFSVHAEMYKCAENGRTIYQDRPCAASGYPLLDQSATGDGGGAPPSKPASKDVGNQPSAADRLQSDVNALVRTRRQHEIEYAMEALQRRITNDRSAMESELAWLQRKKVLAMNNLAGATWEQSISTEMQAVSEKYRIDISLAQDELSQLRKDLSDLKTR